MAVSSLHQLSRPLRWKSASLGRGGADSSAAPCSEVAARCEGPLAWQPGGWWRRWWRSGGGSWLIKARLKSKVLQWLGLQHDDPPILGYEPQILHDDHGWATLHYYMADLEYCFQWPRHDWHTLHSKEVANSATQNLPGITSRCVT